MLARACASLCTRVHTALAEGAPERCCSLAASPARKGCELLGHEGITSNNWLSWFRNWSKFVPMGSYVVRLRIRSATSAPAPCSDGW
jgi:hypothetical protein